MTLQELKEFVQPYKDNETTYCEITYDDFIQLIERNQKLSEALKNSPCDYDAMYVNHILMEQSHSDSCRKCKALSIYGSEVPL